MENYPELVRHLHQRHARVGPTADELLQLRQRSYIESNARTKPLRVRTPTIIEGPTKLAEALIDPQTKRWLWKPRASAGGLRIRFVTLDELYHCSQHQELANAWFSTGYLQEWIAGDPVGFVCTLDDDDAYCTVHGMALGLTSYSINHSTCRELLNSSQRESLSRLMAPTMPGDPTSTSFLYRGSIVRRSWNQSFPAEIVQWLCELRKMTTYRGVLQADFIKSESGQWYFLECNPRWTASCELFELLEIDQPMLRFIGESKESTLHVSHGLPESIAEPSTGLFNQPFSERGSEPPLSLFQSIPCYESCDAALKWVFYAEYNVFISTAISDWMFERRWLESCNFGSLGVDVCWLDIPHGGTTIERGMPIATICAVGEIDKAIESIRVLQEEFAKILDSCVR